MKWRIWKLTRRDISWRAFREWALERKPSSGWAHMWNGWKN